MNRIFAIIFSLQLMMAPLDAKADPGAGAYVKALSSLVLGSTGSVALVSCNFAWSTALFSVASIAMVAGDILLADSYTEYQKGKKEELKIKIDDYKSQNGDIQKEIIDQRLDMEYQELKHIRKRKTLHYAIGSVLTIAAILAIWENIQSIGPVPNPLWISNGSCRLASLKVLGIGVGTLIKMAWGAASSAGGGTSGAGKLFNYLQMGLSLATEAVSNVMSKVFSSGISRGIFFGANAGLVFWVGADLDSRQNIVEENIEKLKKLSANVKSTETPDGLDVDKPKEDSPDKKDGKDKGNIKLLAKGEVRKPCLSIQSSGSSYDQKSCATAVNLKNINFPKGINPLIANVSGNMVSATNDLAKGDWDSAELKLEGVAAQASRVKDLLKTVQKEHNDKLKAAGKPLVDFDGEINKQIASLQESVASASGISPSSVSAPSLANSSPAEMPKTESPSSTPAESAAISIPEFDTGLDGVTTEEIPEDTSATTASLDESLDQYESTVEDISKKSDVSIFKQVSNRYLLNYTKIFKEKKRIEGTP